MEDVPEPIDASLLAVLERSRELGFLGPGPVRPHVLHARSYLHLLDGTRPLRVLDLGSGGGVPGLVLAHERLDLEVTLLDVTEKNPGQWLLKSKVTLEIEGQEKPAYIAEALALCFA